MARLGLIYGALKKARKLSLKKRRNECRLARYVGQAFQLSDDEFYSNYRVSKCLFEDIFAELQPLLPINKRRNDITPKYKVLVTLSFYATGSYQRLVGNSYGTVMSQQSVSRAIRLVTDALNQPSIRDKWIKFPQTFEERLVIKRRFYEKFNIPGVLGCIDGTHIAIIRPRENEERFFNRKHFHSRNVLVICDADLNILSVDSSFGGASHDSFIWNQHPVKSHLISLNNSGENVYLLGDSGYAQREYMMTPIIDAPAGSPENFYTKIHCSARSTVERTVGLLKNRWRCLLKHRVLHYDPITASKIINACCVLHNMCNRILINEELGDLEQDDDTGAEVYQTNVNRNTSEDLSRGIEMRTRLVEQLWASRISWTQSNLRNICQSSSFVAELFKKMGVVTYHVYCRLIGNSIGLILHSVNSLVIFLAMQGDILKDPDIATLKATQFKFITIWNVAFQLIFMSMNLICDIPMILKIKENNKYLEHLRSYKKTFFAGVVWPLTLIIFSVFWPIFIYDRELIFPVFIDKVISLPSNHIMHTAIIIIALWEIFFQPRSKPSVTSHIWNLAHVVVIYVTYLIVVFAYHAESGIWPYPMMKMIYGTIYFPLFFVVVAIVYLICYFVQWPLSNLVFNTCIKSEKIGY